MKKLTVLVIASMITSTGFTFPFYKKHQKLQTLASQNQEVHLSDFSGVWVGACGDSDEDEDGNWEARLTITQNPKQISLTFSNDKYEDNTVVLNLNQLSSQSNSTHNKQEAAIQHIVVPYRDKISINYESMAEEVTSEAGNTLIRTSLHIDLVKNGDTLEMRESIFSGAVCVFKKSG